MSVHRLSGSAARSIGDYGEVVGGVRCPKRMTRTPEDLAARTVLAMLDRCVARDYTDLAALAARFDIDSCVR